MEHKEECDPGSSHACYVTATQEATACFGGATCAAALVDHHSQQILPFTHRARAAPIR